MAGGIVGIATAGVADIARPIIANEAGQAAGDRALKQLRRDYAAARKGQKALLGDLVAANTAMVAGSGAEVAGSSVAGRTGRIARSLDELKRQYIERRDAIWAAQKSSRRHLGTTAAFTLGGLPLQAAGPLATVIGGNEPFSPANPAAGASAGAQIGGMLGATGVGGSAPQVGAGSTFDLPATGGPVGDVGATTLGTRPGFQWYA